MWTRRTWRRSRRVGQMSFYKIGSKKFDEIVMGGSPHIVHQQIPRYGHKDVNGLTFAAGALCFESAHISNQPFNYLHAGCCNLMVLPRSKNVVAFALNKSNSSLLTEIEITELLSQSWRPPGVEQKIHCWQTLSGKRF